MMRKRNILLPALLVTLATACGSVETESQPENVSAETAEGVDADQDPEGEEAETKEEAVFLEAAVNTAETEDAAGKENAAETEDAAGIEDENGMETDREAMVSAYISVLEDICFDHTFPSPVGSDLGFDEMLDPAYNKYAVYDIDQDGKDELIILYTTACNAGMRAFVYAFDADTGAVREEFSEYPSVTYYDNGIIEAEWSHNHGKAADREDFWPYTLYRYDPETDAYVMEAVVNAWSEEFVEKDSSGKPFPKEMDVDGDGMLYSINGEGFGRNGLMDGEAYRQWREDCLGRAKKVALPYASITEENIYDVK